MGEAEGWAASGLGWVSPVLCLAQQASGPLDTELLVLEDITHTHRVGETSIITILLYYKQVGWWYDVTPGLK